MNKLNIKYMTGFFIATSVATGGTLLYLRGVTPILGARCLSNESRSMQEKTPYERKLLFPSYVFGKDLKLVSAEDITHDVKLFKFQLPPNANETGIRPGKAVLASITNKANNKHFFRPYSALYDPEDPSTLQFAIKNENTEGASGAFHKLSPGEKVKFRGPLPIHNVAFEKLPKNVDLIAGGSGITPVFSVLQYLLLEKPETNLTLILANKSPKDIIFKEQLETLQERYAGRLKVVHVLNDPQDFKADYLHSGRVTKDILGTYIRQDRKIFLCGPDGLVNSLVGKKKDKGLLEDVTTKGAFVF